MLYLLLSFSLIHQVLQANQGHFTYALDDPYIHLALSDSLAHGHYGINLGEASSPASSLLWPFLLVPFARFSWFVYVPLALNLLAGAGAAILAGVAVARWPLGPQAQSPRLELLRRLLSVVGLIFIGNLCGLTLIGMEHTLQVLLAGAGAWAILACLRGEPIPLACVIAVAFGPMVRYENMGISLAVAIALVGQQKVRRAVLLLAASILPLIGFSLFLHHLGLPFLPTSVLVKSRVPGAEGFLQHGYLLVQDDLLQTLTERHRMIVAILFVTLAGIAWNERERVRRFALWGATAAAGLHLMVGRFHWFHRYEVYVVFFSALVVLHVLHERPRGVLGWYAFGLLGCSYLYLQAFHDAPISCNQVYRQEYQMHRFVDDFYTGNVAVNDLGLVSFHRPPGTYVLDLWGLASVEAARERNKTTAWLDTTVRAHNVGLVMIYQGWFSPPPADWTYIGQLCLPDTPLALGGSCVSFYGTPATSVDDLRDHFDDFVNTLPHGELVLRPDQPPLYR